MKILGLSAHYHDAAAAVLVDGRVVAAAQEERFTRVKHDPRFPWHAARFCLERAGLRADELDAIAYYEKPFRKFDRILTETLTQAPRGMGRFLRAMPSWLADRLWTRAEIEKRLDTSTKVYFLQHHESHAASAYGPSPFCEAAILTLDGVGEWTTNAVWRAEGSTLQPLFEIGYPDSIGLLYSAFTSYCGFGVNDGEYKLMGLAPYGEPRYVQQILDEVIDVCDDGSYRLNASMFAYRHREAMTTEAFHRLFGGPAREATGDLTRRHADLARSAQTVVEEVILRQARYARKQTAAKALCLAGGVALNCVANAKLLRERVFERVWIQPASGDAGGAVGAAYALWYRLARPGKRRSDTDHQSWSLLGPEFTEEEIECALRWGGFSYTRHANDLEERTAEALERGEVVGWFQGRMEYGPRALGNRSILADPRVPTMQSRVNRAVKFREGFRPFAPIVREVDAAAWFDMPASSPYMLLTGIVRGARPSLALEEDAKIDFGGDTIASPIPAVTHVDASARTQTVPEGSNAPIERVLACFEARTGCGVLLNTSFNVKDEPIVCTPYDAVACFSRTGIDRLAIGPFFTERKAGVREPPPRPVATESLAGVRPWADALAGIAGFVLLHYAAHAAVASYVALGMGFLLTAMGLVSPGARRATQRGVMRLGRSVTHTMGLLILAGLYAFLVVPAAWLLRLIAIPRASPKGASSWRTPEEPDHDPRMPY